MREIAVDAWSVDCDVLCITTNKTIKTNSENVMGGGIAKEAWYRDFDLALTYGSLIATHGHHVYLIRSLQTETGWGNVPEYKSLLMFPTKEEVWEDSNMTTILRSILETKKLADIYRWKTIALPRPGAGLGGLDWEAEVKPVIEPILDDRFLIVSYPS